MRPPSLRRTRMGQAAFALGAVEPVLVSGVGVVPKNSQRSVASFPGAVSFLSCHAQTLRSANAGNEATSNDTPPGNRTDTAVARPQRSPTHS